MIKETPNGYNGNTVPPRGNPETNRITGDPSKGDPVVMDSMFKGWEITDKDMVQYKDMQRRGLQFLFSAVRKAPNTVIYSPMNKFVSVYQKQDDTEENAGDFVLVSVSAGNPNDIRVMDITNEYYGDTNVDPMYLIQKSIEMADDSGMLRLVEEFADYGKVDSIMEFAEDNIFAFGPPIMKETTEKIANNINGSKSDSPITTHADSISKGEKKDTILNRIGRVLQQFTSKIQTGRTTELGTSTFVNAVKAGQKKVASEKTDQFDLATHKHKLAMERDAAGFQAKSGMQDKQLNTAKDIASERNKTTIKSREIGANILTPEQRIEEAKTQAGRSVAMTSFNNPQTTINNINKINKLVPQEIDKLPEDVKQRTVKQAKPRILPTNTPPLKTQSGSGKGANSVNTFGTDYNSEPLLGNKPAKLRTEAVKPVKSTVPKVKSGK